MTSLRASVRRVGQERELLADGLLAASSRGRARVVFGLTSCVELEHIGRQREDVAARTKTAGRLAVGLVVEQASVPKSIERAGDGVVRKAEVARETTH